MILLHDNAQLHVIKNVRCS